MEDLGRWQAYLRVDSSSGWRIWGAEGRVSGVFLPVGGRNRTVMGGLVAGDAPKMASGRKRKR